MATKSITPHGISQDALVAYLCNVKNSVNEIVNALHGDYVESNTQLSAGTNTCKILHCAGYYRINGEMKALTGACIDVTGCAVPACTYGAWRVERSATATCVIPATANATGYATAALALAGLPALTADNASLGTIVLVNGTCDFVPKTVALDCADICITFADGTTTANAIACTALSLSSITVAS